MNQPTSRRDFLKTSAALAGAAAATHLALPSNVHAGGDDLIKVGLIGCGGRGRGAAEQAVNAGPNIKLVALGDVFPDHLAEAKRILKKDLGDKYAVPDENCFSGFEAYKHVLDAGVDVVCLTTPPHFRPLHFKAAIEAGKHTFVEKPVAVDAPGVHSILETVKKAKEKKLAVVSGLCWRYHHAKRETFAKIHDGAIGDIMAMQCTYNTGYLRCFKRENDWSDMEYQLRNWLYYTWLSGDHYVEQHIHSLDKMLWAMKDEVPVKAFGVGGRQVRTEEVYGHIFDHHAVVFEFKNGVKAFSMCRQQENTDNEIKDFLFGTKGVCDVMAHGITGASPWRAKANRKDSDDMYQNEHNELFASIRSGEPINDGERMAKATMMAILGRMASYTGKVIEWKDAMASKENLSPAKYEWCPLPTPEVARPGITKFV
jgi:myo-inositol 2-dehydrogenase/D-chiro-inositol 1-dehydrogenase